MFLLTVPTEEIARCKYKTGLIIFALNLQTFTIILDSGAGTNLKVREGASVRSESGGHQKNFFGRAPPLFLALKAQLVILVSAFVMVSTVWSVSCLLFFYSRCSRSVPSHL